MLTGCDGGILQNLGKLWGHVDLSGAFLYALLVALFTTRVDPVAELLSEDRVQQVVDPPAGQIRTVLLVGEVLPHALVLEESYPDLFQANVLVAWHLDVLDVLVIQA